MAATDVKNDASLGASLISFWELEEASGTRVDSVTGSGNDLTENGTGGVGQGAGQQGNCADFVAGDLDYLSIADASQSGLDITGDMSLACWVKFTSTATQMSFAGKWATSNKSFYWLHNHTTNQLRFNTVANGTSGDTNVNVSWTPSSATWYHVGIAYDASAGSVKFYVDGSQQGTTQTGLNTSMFNGTAPWQMGTYTGSSLPIDGLLDEFGVWNKLLDDTDFSNLYASGTGIPFDAGGGGATFVPKVMIY